MFCNCGSNAVKYYYCTYGSRECLRSPNDIIDYESIIFYYIIDYVVLFAHLIAVKNVIKII